MQDAHALNYVAMEQKIIHGDCLEEMRKLEDNCIDLVIIDPPYNIGKDTWDKIDNYEEWMKEVFIEIQRVLKDNGSFYWWHNEMTTISKLINILESDTNFIFKQMIVWNKRFDGSPRKGFLNGFIEVKELRNYQKMSEYCLFYTLQDDFIDKRLYINCVSEIQDYVKNLIYKYGGNVTMANEFYCKYSGKTGNYRGLFFGKSQPVLYTEQQYNGLIEYIKSLGCLETIKEYREILLMSDKEKFKDSRYTFNNQKTHHSVWNYDIDKKIGHVTPKPLEMIKNIIKHSSNEGDVILDCFGGSGTTAVACKELGRNCIMIESKEEYIDLINKRIEATTLKN